MIRFFKDIIFGEPVLSITVISLVLTSWLSALTQVGEAVPLWLAIAAPSAIALGGFYAKAVSTPTRPDLQGADEEE